MATSSLGRLTLDLVINLADYVDGMSRAERETRDRTRDMQQSVRSFRENLANDLSGTEIGDIFQRLNERFGSLEGGALRVGGALAGMAVGGVAVGIGALSALAVETAKADAEMAVLANRANTNIETFQVLGTAAEGLGINQEQLASILADTQEKIGEFSATEGGGAADFFDALRNNTKMTDDQIKEFGKTLQGKDGVEAIQLIKNKMDELGATSQEQRFVFESLASDLANLLPLFADGGKLLGEYGEALRDAGVIKTKEAIEQSQLLAAQTQSVRQRFDGFKSQLAGQMIPILGSLAQYFLEGGQKGSAFGGIIQGVGVIAKGVASVLLVFGGAISFLGDTIGQYLAQMGNVGHTALNVLMADGVEAKMKALSEGFQNFKTMGSDYVSSTVNRFKELDTAIGNVVNGQTTATDKLTKINLDLSQSQHRLNDGLGKSTKQADEERKAIEKNTKAKQDNAKAGAKSAKAGSLLPTATANAILWGANKLGIDPNHLASVISFETGGTFSTNARNPGSSGTGLIQFMDGADNKNDNKYYGMSRNQFGGLSVAEQMKYVVRYFQERGLRPGAGVGKVYDLVTGTGYRRGSKAYAQNKLWDANNDGYIAPGESVTSRAFKAHMRKYFTGGTDKIAIGEIDSQIAKQDASSEEKAKKEAERQAEELAKARLSITQKYASEVEKIEKTHTDNLAEINRVYAVGSTENLQLTKREEERYQTEKNARAKSISLEYMDEEAKLLYKHNQALEKIKEAFAENDPNRQIYLNKEEEMYQKDLAKSKWAAGEKERTQKALVDKLKEDIADSNNQSVSAYTDSKMKATMSPQQYERWKLQQSYQKDHSGVIDKYASRDAEINKKDDEGNYALGDTDRYALQLQAKEEFNAQMLLLDQTYAEQQKEINASIVEQNLTSYGSMFGSLTELTKSFAGEQSTAYRVMFAIQKGFAVAQSIIAIQQTIAKAMSVGFPANIPLVAQAIAQGAQIITSIRNVKEPSVGGVAHGGLDYVPKETTFLLDKGERVLSPRQNKDLTNYLGDRQKASKPNIQINNNSSAQVSAEHTPDGVSVEMVDKMIKRSFGRIGEANSFESRQIQRHTTARFNRR